MKSLDLSLDPNFPKAWPWWQSWALCEITLSPSCSPGSEIKPLWLTQIPPFYLLWTIPGSLGAVFLLSIAGRDGKGAVGDKGGGFTSWSKTQNEHLAENKWSLTRCLAGTDNLSAQKFILLLKFSISWSFFIFQVLFWKGERPFLVFWVPRASTLTHFELSVLE